MKIPKGYRRLKNNEALKKGDKFYSQSLKQWVCTCIPGRVAGNYRAYIRPIATPKSPKKSGGKEKNKISIGKAESYIGFLIGKIKHNTRIIQKLIESNMEMQRNVRYLNHQINLAKSKAKNTISKKIFLNMNKNGFEG